MVCLIVAHTVSYKLQGGREGRRDVSLEMWECMSDRREGGREGMMRCV